MQIISLRHRVEDTPQEHFVDPAAKTHAAVDGDDGNPVAMFANEFGIAVDIYDFQGKEVDPLKPLDDFESVIAKAATVAGEENES